MAYIQGTGNQSLNSNYVEEEDEEDDEDNESQAAGNGFVSAPNKSPRDLSLL